MKITETESNPYDVGSPEHAAYGLGVTAGVAAGGWVFDGNTTSETYRRFAASLADDESELWDIYSGSPLSGESPDGLTPAGLAVEQQPVDAIDDVTMDFAACAYEAGRIDGYRQEVERVLRYQLRGNNEDQ